MSGSTAGGQTLDDTVAYPVWSWQLDELLALVLGLTVVEVARLQGFAYRRKHEPEGWEPDAGVQAFIAELWERCFAGPS